MPANTVFVVCVCLCFIFRLFDLLLCFYFLKYILKFVPREKTASPKCNTHLVAMKNVVFCHDRCANVFQSSPVVAVILFEVFVCMVALSRGRRAGLACLHCT